MSRLVTFHTPYQSISLNVNGWGIDIYSRLTLGVLEEGEEWLAVVFRDQEPDKMEECGLDVTSHRFVRAGFATDYSESKGKEILVFTRKGKCLDEE